MAQVADRDQVWILLGQLPNRQRAAVVMRYFHDLSDVEIGAALGCRVGTVRSLISRALASLRQHRELVDDPGTHAKRNLA